MLIALYWWEDRVFEGVARFAAEQGWILDCRMRWLRTIPELPGWKGDGIIANPGSSHPVKPLIDLITSSKLPTVGLQSFGNYPSSARVLLDHGRIGRVGAEHFLGLDFRRLGFVRFAENPMETARCEGFAATARRAKVVFEEIPFTGLSERLGALPEPIGLMAANDLNAHAVATTCLDLGLKVPEEAAVLGVDDSQILCDFAEIPLSSVNCRFEQQGYQAAATLQRLMNGASPPSKPVIISPLGVTKRRSTDTVGIPDIAAVKALRLIRDHFREPLQVTDVARGAGASIRQLQDSFRRHLDTTMVREIGRLRIEHARKLLADKSLKLDAVALDCGFSGRFQFIRAFRRFTGETPTDYRKKLAESGLLERQ